MKRCRDDGFNFWDIAAVMVEEHKELRTIRLLRNCFNVKHHERNEARLNRKQRKGLVGEKKVVREVHAQLPHEEPS